MLSRRICCLAALMGCAGFYVAHGEWVSWVLLVCVAGLPWLSLILSLPAMLRFRMWVQAPAAVALGVEAQAELLGSSDFPLPPFRGKLRVTPCIAGAPFYYREAKGLPTQVCGGLKVEIVKGKVCDYLGLFAFSARRAEPVLVKVRPQPVPVTDLPGLENYLAAAWRPKPGGGFAENHELRLFRPGDSQNQIHWKLSAKTGKLMLRQPMEPLRGRVAVTMNLRGTPEELNRKFGRLLWTGQYLLQRQTPFEIRVLTGGGIYSFQVAREEHLTRAIDALLCYPAAQSGSIADSPCAASWHYHVGGEPDET